MRCREPDERTTAHTIDLAMSAGVLPIPLVRLSPLRTSHGGETMAGLFVQIDCSLLNQPRWRVLSYEARLFYIQLIAWSLEQGHGRFSTESFFAELSLEALGNGCEPTAFDLMGQLAKPNVHLVEWDEKADSWCLVGFDDRYGTMMSQRDGNRIRAQRARDKKRDVTANSTRDVRERNGVTSRDRNGANVDVDVESYVEQPAESKPPSKETQDPVKGLSLYEQDAKLLKAWPKLYSTWLHLADGNSAWIDQQITAAHSWEIANPKRRKKDRPRFLNGWITRNWASRQAAGPPSRELPLYTSSDTEGTS